MTEGSAPVEPSPWWRSWQRVWDGLAILVVLFVAWKWLVAPRMLDRASAYPAPHVSYARLDGGTFALTAHRGRVVFLDFWASWCGPCKLSLPIAEGYAKAHPDVDVIPVDVGEPRVTVAAFAKLHDLHGVVLDPPSFSNQYFQIQGFPTMVVVDPEGRIRATWIGFNPALAVNMENARKTLTGMVN
ncbi:MAG: TlpA family protein disulfide reductase [Candidatus Eremiobacteraeota bacterium]|nr:TlpA family protein disulfide reductase [Candidatus Eremiobacteraeota bacterium]